MGWSLIIIMSLNILTGFTVIVMELYHSAFLIYQKYWLRIKKYFQCYEFKPLPPERPKEPEIIQPQEILYYHQNPINCLVAGKPTSLLDSKNEKVKETYLESDTWRHQAKPLDIEYPEYLKKTPEIVIEQNDSLEQFSVPSNTSNRPVTQKNNNIT